MKKYVQNERRPAAFALTINSTFGYKFGAQNTHTVSRGWPVNDAG